MMRTFGGGKGDRHESDDHEDFGVSPCDEPERQEDNDDQDCFDESPGLNVGEGGGVRPRASCVPISKVSELKYSRRMLVLLNSNLLS